MGKNKERRFVRTVFPPISLYTGDNLPPNGQDGASSWWAGLNVMFPIHVSYSPACQVSTFQPDYYTKLIAACEPGLPTAWPDLVLDLCLILERLNIDKAGNRWMGMTTIKHVLHTHPHPNPDPRARVCGCDSELNGIMTAFLTGAEMKMSCNL